MNISVIGSGAWGTALALLLIENGHKVTLWSHYAHEMESMKKSGENPFLPGVPLSAALVLTSDIGCVSSADASDRLCG